jgi:hypothetical protein
VLHEQVPGGGAGLLEAMPRRSALNDHVLEALTELADALRDAGERARRRERAARGS